MNFEQVIKNLIIVNKARLNNWDLDKASEYLQKKMSTNEFWLWKIELQAKIDVLEDILTEAALYQKLGNWEGK